jgi:hypothetical protein
MIGVLPSLAGVNGMRRGLHCKGRWKERASTWLTSALNLPDPKTYLMRNNCWREDGRARYGIALCSFVA